MPLQDQGVFGEPLGEGSSEHCNLLFVWGVLQLCEVVTVSQLEKLRSIQVGLFYEPLKSVPKECRVARWPEEVTLWMRLVQKSTQGGPQSPPL